MIFLYWSTLHFHTLVYIRIILKRKSVRFFTLPFSMFLHEMQFFTCYVYKKNVLLIDFSSPLINLLQQNDNTKPILWINLRYIVGFIERYETCFAARTYPTSSDNRCRRHQRRWAPWCACLTDSCSTLTYKTVLFYWIFYYLFIDISWGFIGNFFLFLFTNDKFTVIWIVINKFKIVSLNLKYNKNKITNKINSIDATFRYLQKVFRFNINNGKVIIN